MRNTATFLPALLAALCASAQASDTAFTYQGETVAAANGLYDLQLCLEGAGCRELEAVPVEQGQFTVTLDFGAAAFEARERTLDVAWRPEGSSEKYASLGKRALAPLPAACTDSRCTYVDATSSQAKAATGPFSRPTITTLNTGPDNAGQYSSIAIGPDGFPQIAFYEYTMDQVPTVGTFKNGDAKFVRCNDPACSGPLTIGFVQSDDEVVRDAGAFMQVKFDSAGFPMYAFYDRGGPRPQDAVENVAFSRCPRNGCVQASSNLDGPVSVGKYTSLVIAQNDIPVLAYYDETNGELKVVRCLTNDCTGSVETRIRVADNGGVANHNVGHWTSIAQDSTDRSLISYYDVTEGDLKVVRCAATAFAAGGSCDAPVTVDSTGDVGKYTDIVMGPNDLPVISYYDATNGWLKVAKCTAPRCETATITVVDDSPEETADVGYYSSIVIPSDGLPVISYIDDTNKALKLAKCHKADCSLVTQAGSPEFGTAATLTKIDEGSVITGVTALTFGADTFPIMTYPVLVNGVERIRVAKSNTPDGTEDKFFQDGFE